MKNWALVLLCFACSMAGFSQIPRGKIIYSSGVQGSGTSDLFVINSDGTNEVRITNDGGTMDFCDYFRGRLVYMETERLNDFASFYLSDMNGTGKKLLIEHEVICNPKWQPGGKTIAYELYHDNKQEVWAMDTNGRYRYCVASNARHPYWTADGRMLLFTRDYEVFEYDMEKKQEHQLTHLTDQHLYAKWPAISHDEKKLAFKAFEKGRSGGYPEIGIMIIDLKTQAQTTVPDCEIPYWTDDNQFFVCDCFNRESRSYQVAIVNAETGEKTFVTRNNRSNYFPIWVTGN